MDNKLCSLTKASNKQNKTVLLINSHVQNPPLCFGEAPLGLMNLNAGIKKFCQDVNGIIVDHRGADEEESLKILNKNLAEHNPSIVGISSFSAYMADAIKTAKAVKKYNQDIPVVLGGHHATSYPEGILKYTDFDFFVSGHGIQPGAELINALFNDGNMDQIKSISFRKNGRLVINPEQDMSNINLDDYPSLDWSDLDLNSYKSSSYKKILPNIHIKLKDDQDVMPYIASYGCPYKCNFCERVCGNSAKYYSVDKVINDIKRMTKILGTRYVIFYDLIIHINKKWFSSFLDELKNKTDLVLFAGLRMDLIEKETIDKMIKAGFLLLFSFPESASERIRLKMNKRINLNKLADNVRYASEKGVFTIANFIFGWPGETVKEAEDSIKLAEDDCFDFVTFNNLINYGRAEAGKNLEKLNIQPDTMEYFDYLNNYNRYCLADYDIKKLNDFLSKSVELNKRKFSRKSVSDKFNNIGITDYKICEDIYLPKDHFSSINKNSPNQKKNEYLETIIRDELIKYIENNYYRIIKFELLFSDDLPSIKLFVRHDEIELIAFISKANDRPCYLKTRFFNISYSGSDISGSMDKMIKALYETLIYWENSILSDSSEKLLSDNNFL
jgi:anaerobic magnesium-protoporphyrin IX monomethyl ester cyclase